MAGSAAAAVSGCPLGGRGRTRRAALHRRRCSQRAIDCIRAVAAAIIVSFPSHSCAPHGSAQVRTRGFPMPHTLRAAAKAVGRDRTTLLRAIRAGKLSAIHDAATGSWLIEPAELHRVYPPVNG